MELLTAGELVEVFRYGDAISKVLGDETELRLKVHGWRDYRCFSLWMKAEFAEKVRDILGFYAFKALLSGRQVGRGLSL